MQRVRKKLLKLVYLHRTIRIHKN